MKDWGVKQRLSSVDYPQSNGRAELGVKASKRIIAQNTSRNGSLNTDKAVRAILQYRNTPLPELGLSPAQLLLHRQLRDSVPSHPKHYRLHKEWVVSAQEREKAYSDRNKLVESRYNQRAHSLQPLSVKSLVRIQEKGRWNRTGRIVEVLPFRQYRIRMDGSGRVTIRNRRFLKPLQLGETKSKALLPSPLDSGEHGGSACTDTPVVTPPSPTIEQEDSPYVSKETAEPPADPIHEGTPAKAPKALRELLTYNKEGLLEESSAPPQSRLRSGRL